MAAFIQYLNFDGENLLLPDSYEVSMSDVEADSGGGDQGRNDTEGCGQVRHCGDWRELFRDSELAEEANDV